MILYIIVQHYSRSLPCQWLQVYKATLDATSGAGNEVAVKVLQPEAGEMQRFEEEVSIMRACQDKRIVEFYGAFISQVGGVLHLLSFNVSRGPYHAIAGLTATSQQKDALLC